MNLSKVSALLLAAVCLTGCMGRYMCNYALRPKNHGRDIENSKIYHDKFFPGSATWYDSLAAAGVFKDTVITGEGGYKLHAVYGSAPADKKAEGCVILVHGYTSNFVGMLNLARLYRDTLNYNVVVPDLHYHGLSEGIGAQFGWKDRLDVMRWIDLAHDVWNDDFMVVHGISMGGATTMMVSGEELPEYVGAFVDDCGYTSAWDQFEHNMKQMFAWLPAKNAVLESASKYCEKTYGWNFKEASSVNQLAKCKRPMLFIHGDKDDFVPTAMVYENYEAKVDGYKEIWLAPDAGHGLSYKTHPAEYYRRVRDFLIKAKELRGVK